MSAGVCSDDLKSASEYFNGILLASLFWTVVAILYGWNKKYGHRVANPHLQQYI